MKTEITLTAAELHTFYGVPLPATWRGDEELTVSPGECRAADGSDFGDLTDMAPDDDEFEELTAERAAAEALASWRQVQAKEAERLAAGEED